MIINFNNSPPIDYCIFDNITISCYQPNTCILIEYNGKNITDVEAEKEFGKCSVKEIEKFLNSKEISPFTYIIIIVGIYIGIVIGIIIGLIYFIKIRYKNNKHTRYIYNDKFDEFRNGSIKVVLNKKRRNNTNTEINNTNTNNSNDSSNNKNNNDDGDENNGYDDNQNLIQSNSNNIITINVNNQEKTTKNIYNASIAKNDKSSQFNNNSNFNIYNASVVEENINNASMVEENNTSMFYGNSMVNTKEETNIYNASVAEIGEISLSRCNNNANTKDEALIYNASTVEEYEPQPDDAETNNLISK